MPSVTHTHSFHVMPSVTHTHSFHVMPSVTHMPKKRSQLYVPFGCNCFSFVDSLWKVEFYPAVLCDVISVVTGVHG
jgi:hypothetical protein